MSGVVRRLITAAKDAPAAIGAYRWVFTVLVILALKNMGAVLHAANIDYKNVVKCTVMLADINDFKEMNDIYSKYFSDFRPARVAFQAGSLPKGAKVEIDAIAMVDAITDIN
ncbi:2-iminobutanoate/2-iminopropanoate deaminase-like [Anneissia japonica]|uniref:2-iminobutanoate/2-iminopropanoate deaminase-like n=1 Tax=Anneissia japonica TaxID=1529436 RepID=UPI0014255BC7|nr:2-iminobutanoate/2-iminopropanoate deaminase-like [Anneissia japonica]